MFFAWNYFLEIAATVIFHVDVEVFFTEFSRFGICFYAGLKIALICFISCFIYVWNKTFIKLKIWPILDYSNWIIGYNIYFSQFHHTFKARCHINCIYVDVYWTCLNYCLPSFACWVINAIGEQAWVSFPFSFY